MRVLQVGKFFPVRGGVEKVMYDLMIGLTREGIDCDMLCATQESASLVIRRLHARARLICVPVWKKVASTMLSPSMIFQLRRIHANYDIIHIHHPDPMACLSLFFSGYRGKVVLHWHSDILKQRFLLRLYGPLQTWLLRRSDLILGTSPVYVRESLALRRYQYKVDYIPIGIDPIVPNKDSVDTFRRSYPGKKIIFSLGRLVEYKGYRYLISSAQYLPDNYLIIIGGMGELQGDLEALIRELGVEEKVLLVGYVREEDVATYYGSCDVFCLSSIQKTEAFGIVQLEAMSCGKPVVSTQISGSGVSWVNRDGESGHTVIPENPIELAQAIERILADTTRYEKYSERSRLRYQNVFTLDRMVKRCISMYETVLKSVDYTEGMI